MEKFIGDAVVGVFGVPQAHEDDPERAVRAALRICEEAESLPALRGAPLRLRIGINTGPALVRLDVTPGAGERFLAGDAVNTASRIQSVAPEMGVAVGEATWQATKRRFEYEELPPATLKGKAEPVRVFHPIAPAVAARDRPVANQRDAVRRPSGGAAAPDELFDDRSRNARSGSRRSSATPASARAGSSPSCSPTSTRSRSSSRGARDDACRTGRGSRSGRSARSSRPTPGSSTRTAPQSRWRSSTGRCPQRDERAWLRDRLLPLLGVESGPTAGRDEQFAAWRRFLELVAEARPTVLVFEDLHWADDSMLTFLEDLASRPAAVPLFVIGTTRPELFDRRPAFPGAADAVRVDLRPLSVGRGGHPGDGVARRRRDLARAARADPRPRRRQPAVRGGVRPAAPRPRPARRQGRPTVPARRCSAARPGVDPGPAGRPPRRASAGVEVRPDRCRRRREGVLGRRGGGDGRSGTRHRRRPARACSAAREFIRIAPRSSMAGETEYAFWHVLVRDVAYGALPRAARASRHVAAARWIEAQAGDRVEDVADVLAHHYSTALGLARADRRRRAVVGARSSRSALPAARRGAGARARCRGSARLAGAGARARAGGSP